MKFFLLITILYLGSAQAALVEKYPQTELFTLSNDVVIGLPMHVYNSSGMAVVGTIDIDMAHEILKEQNLHPLEVIPGKGLAIVYALDYRSASIPAYQEAIVSLVVKEGQTPGSYFQNLTSFSLMYVPFLKKILTGRIPYTGTYLHKISVTDDIARRVGLEVWGAPKVMENFRYESNSNITAVDAHEFSFQLHKKLSVPAPLSVYTTTFTPTTFLKTRFESLLQGSARFGVIRKSDKFEAGPELLRLKFKPLIWQEFLNTEAVFFRRNLAN